MCPFTKIWLDNLIDLKPDSRISRTRSRIHQDKWPPLDGTLGFPKMNLRIIQEGPRLQGEIINRSTQNEGTGVVPHSLKSVKSLHIVTTPRVHGRSNQMFSICRPRPFDLFPSNPFSIFWYQSSRRMYSLIGSFVTWSVSYAHVSAMYDLRGTDVNQMMM